MHNSYDDIRNRIAEPPKWFDENGVPRYSDFHPSDTHNVYADEAVLMEITCQACGTVFHVGMSASRFMTPAGMELHNLIKNADIHYGDPPNTGCCAAGPTMNSEPRRILQYWKRDDLRAWVRDPSFEGPLYVEWVRSNDEDRRE